MVNTVDLAARVTELELELDRLRAERVESASDGALLKTLLDDIARRRGVEEQLRDAYEWLDLAQRAGSVAAYSYCFQSQKLDWSPSVLALYGFEQGCTPTVEKWLGSIHADDLPAVQRVADDALQDGADVDHRFRIVRPDGSVRWIQDRGRVMRDEQGGLKRLVGINIDVTELVALQMDLSAKSDRLCIALEAGRQACWDWDLATNKVVWDENLSRFAGVAEFGGSFESFWELVHEDDKPSIRAALDAALSGASDYAVEFRMRRADGSVRWTSTRAKVVRDEHGKPLSMVGIDADITDRKEAEDQLQVQEDFLRSVLDVSSDCVKTVELDGTLSYMNENGLCEMELDSFAAVEGQCWSSLWPPESANLVEDAVANARLGRKSRFEGFCPTAKGTPKWWDVAIAPMVDRSGKVVRIVSLSRDITERKAKEEQLGLLNRELHHRVKNNLATVQAIARATAKSARTLEEFDASFSARLAALAQTHGLLFSGNDATTIGELVEAELKPFAMKAAEVQSSGPAVTLPPAEAVALGMIFHELTTNACKYGGLSTDGEGLDVRWEILDEASRRQVRIEWLERRKAPARSPNADGFGSKLITRLTRSQLQGTVSRDFDSGGFHAVIQFPLY